MDFFGRVYQKDPAVVTRLIGGEVVLVPIQQKGEGPENIFTLNDMAAGIWVQLNGNNSLNIIKERILSSFEITPKQAEKDLIEFISQLEELGVIFCQSK